MRHVHDERVRQNHKGVLVGGQFHDMRNLVEAKSDESVVILDYVPFHDDVWLKVRCPSVEIGDRRISISLIKRSIKKKNSRDVVWLCGLLPFLVIRRFVAVWPDVKTKRIENANIQHLN